MAQTLTDLDFMQQALGLAQLAAGVGEVPVGAVVVHQGQVIGRGHNQTLAQHDITAHAEIVALRQATTFLGNHRLDDCELYVTLEPCLMCSGAVMGARIRRLVWGAAEPKSGAAGSVLNVFADSRLNHHTAVSGGVLAAECGAELQHFFQARRQAQAVDRSTHYLREDALRLPAAHGPDWPAGVQSLWHQATPALPALDGHRLHVLAAGQGGETAVIALHSPRQWSAAYADAAVHCAAHGLAFYAPDLLGFGLSDKPKKPAWHTLDRHAAVLAEWMATLPQSRLALVAPASMATLVQRLAQAASLHASWCINETALDPALHDVPYPDAGHRVAWRVLPGLLAPATAQTPAWMHLAGEPWPQLCDLLATPR